MRCCPGFLVAVVYRATSSATSTSSVGSQCPPANDRKGSCFGHPPRPMNVGNSTRVRRGLYPSSNGTTVLVVCRHHLLGFPKSVAFRSYLGRHLTIPSRRTRIRPCLPYSIFSVSLISIPLLPPSRGSNFCSLNCLVLLSFQIRLSLAESFRSTVQHRLCSPTATSHQRRSNASHPLGACGNDICDKNPGTVIRAGLGRTQIDHLR